MSYYETLLPYQSFPFEEFFGRVSSENIEEAIQSNRQDEHQLLTLLSPTAENHLETIAERAHQLTSMHFGKTIQLYTPIYISNYCDNQCAYFGFNASHDLPRKKLSPEEIEKEAAFISSSGLKHILILTGESKTNSSLDYLTDCVQLLKKYFSSIAVEIPALTENEYAGLIEAGVDGLTLYQETYDETIYRQVHQAGPKKDYLFRLTAPERAGRQGMRAINIGALLGLANWRKDVFFLGFHAKYLQDLFPDAEIGVSIPRLKSHPGHFNVLNPVSDKNMAQIVTALRIFLPRLGISLSNREKPELRENLLPLGITRMSAGSSTKVGGHTVICNGQPSLPQFEIADTRNVEEIKIMLAAKGYQPVLKDWMPI